MLLTVFLTIVFCTAMALLYLSAVALVQNEKMFSSAPKEVQAVIQPRPTERFRGARAIGWTLMGLSIAIVLGVGVIAIWDGLRSGFTFAQFFARFVTIFTVYKVLDMVLIDYFLLMKSRFFQHYYPEIEDVFPPKKYGFNLKSQLLKLIVVFPAASALAAWACTLV